MKYDLFLIDLDDTLLNFKASERLCFFSMLDKIKSESSEIHLSLFNVSDGSQKKRFAKLFKDYQIENKKLWTLFEEGSITQEFLKVERFRKAFEENQLDFDAKRASQLYLEELPRAVVLIEGAVELCQGLSQRGEVGIITNGIQSVQELRIKNSGLNPYISFLSVSEECGYPKPDKRFFEYTLKKAKTFTKEKTLMIGDRLETDILGANRFGIDSCYFTLDLNFNENDVPSDLKPKLVIHQLSDLFVKLKD